MDALVFLATLPAILALVDLLKKLGLPSKAALLVAVLLGVGLSVSDHLWAADPLYQAIAQGLILGLGAAGVYNVAATVGNPTVNLAGVVVDEDETS